MIFQQISVQCQGCFLPADVTILPVPDLCQGSRAGGGVTRTRKRRRKSLWRICVLGGGSGGGQGGLAGQGEPPLKQSRPSAGSTGSGACWNCGPSMSQWICAIFLLDFFQTDLDISELSSEYLCRLQQIWGMLA